MINKKSTLSKRYELSYKDKPLTTKKGIMDWSKPSIAFDFYKPSKGHNLINIIPYKIKSPNHPQVVSGDFEIGELDYLLDVYVHRNIGANSSTIMCLQMTYGKPCPICEERKRLWKDGKENEAKSLNASRRVFYNVQDLNSDSDDIKVFETSYVLFEKELIDESRNVENGDFVDFADLEDGKKISFRATIDKLNGNEFFRFKSFSFIDREKSISEEIIERTVSFDEAVNVPTYDEVKSLFYGEDENESDTDLDVEDDDLEELPNTQPENNIKIGNGCEFGHTFGKDCDKFDECDNCDNWEKCVKFKG